MSNIQTYLLIFSQYILRRRRKTQNVVSVTFCAVQMGTSTSKVFYTDETKPLHKHQLNQVIATHYYIKVISLTSDDGESFKTKL